MAFNVCFCNQNNNNKFQTSPVDGISPPLLGSEKRFPHTASVGLEELLAYKLAWAMGPATEWLPHTKDMFKRCLFERHNELSRF